MIIAYRFLINLIFILSPIILFFRFLRKKEHPKRYKEKLCYFTKQRGKGKLLWFHGASVGELQSIIPLIEKISKFYNKIKPEVVYMPYDHDVHTDHQIICNAVLSMIKWFRYPYINKVLMYETLSETDFNLGQQNSFKPNTYVDISNYIDKKIKAMSIYESEIESFPFPRSKEAIKSLAMLRGSQSGFNFAESFVSIYEKIK